jgi:MFS family permease
MADQVNQFRLFSQRRFAPYFGVQFLGALNDNFFKTALLMLISIRFATSDPGKAHFLTNLGAGAFIFPFFIFSGVAGQLADKYDKKSLIQKIKFAEILIAVLIAIGFYIDNLYFLLGALFLLGIQASFFSPVKYSILPDYLAKEELLGANAIVEMGTFTAILIGTILGGLLISQFGAHITLLPMAILMFAFVGWLLSHQIPQQKKPTTTIKINLNPITQIWHTVNIARQNHQLWWTIIAISWFWFFGSIILTQIPNYTMLILGADATVMTLILTLTSFGIGFGSLLCEKLSGGKLEIGLVVLGAFGLSLFLGDLCFANGETPPQVIGISAFLQTWQNWRVLGDLFMIGVFCGFYSVPLYVLMQTLSDDQTRSQIVAANNILNALFMTIASLVALVLLELNLNIIELFMVVCILNLAVTLWVFNRVPQFLVRFREWSGLFRKA